MYVHNTNMFIFTFSEARPPRKNYNPLSSNEKLDNRQQDDIHIEEAAAAAESDASSTDLDERDTRGVCPPCAHDRYNNNIRRHAHDDFSDDSDYGKRLRIVLTSRITSNSCRRWSQSPVPGFNSSENRLRPSRVKDMRITKITDLILICSLASKNFHSTA